MEDDIRGFDLKVEHLKLQLINLINEYNLPVSVLKLLMQELIQEINALYQKTIDEQYKAFCKAAQEEKQPQAKEEEENSSSSND